MTLPRAMNGFLEGPDMRIEWELLKFDPIAQTNRCNMAVGYIDGEGKKYVVRGGFDFDPINLVRLLDDEDERRWKKLLVEMATVLVEGAQEDARKKAERS